MAIVPHPQHPDGTRVCPKCHEAKPLDQFVITNKSGRYKPSAACRDCRNAFVRDQRKEKPEIYKGYRLRYYANNPNARHDSKASSWKRHYGITRDDYDQMLSDQGGVCAICGRPETKISRGALCHLSVDHDHVTGKIRGLLCSACNIGIGAFHDDTEIMARAIRYLAERR